jgi:hypothetical protein
MPETASPPAHFEPLSAGAVPARIGIGDTFAQQAETRMEDRTRHLPQRLSKREQVFGNRAPPQRNS